MPVISDDLLHWQDSPVALALWLCRQNERRRRPNPRRAAHITYTKNEFRVQLIENDEALYHGSVPLGVAIARALEDYEEVSGDRPPPAQWLQNPFDLPEEASCKY